jgi:hypothetical protein
MSLLSHASCGGGVAAVRLYEAGGSTPTTHDVRFKTVSAGASSCQTPPNLEKMGEPEIGWDDTGEWVGVGDYDVLSCYLWDKCDRRQQGCKG